MIFRAQCDFGMELISIIQSYDLIGACLISLVKILKKLRSKFLPPILQICLLKLDRFYWFAQKGLQKRPNISAGRTFFKRAYVLIFVQLL